VSANSIVVLQTVQGSLECMSGMFRSPLMAAVLWTSQFPMLVSIAQIPQLSP
jgi:hypothetical protein